MENKLGLFRSQVIKAESAEFLKEAAELAVDSVIEDGLLKELPLIGTLVNLFKIGKGVKEVFEVKKLAAFFLNIQDIDEDDKKAFDEKLGKPEFKEEFYSRLLILLEKLDEVQKAEIIANFFRLYIYNIISKNEFFRFSKIVDRGYLGDLLVMHYPIQQLKGLGAASQELIDLRYDEIVQENLLSLGLLRKKTEDEIEKEKENNLPMSTEYFPTKMGYMFSFMMYYNDNFLDQWRKNGWNG
jgi:hypothetical protein